MNKCTDIELGQIKRAFNIANIKSRKDTVSELRTRMIQVIEDLTEQFSLIDTQELANVIYNAMQTYGIIGRSNFFNLTNIQTAIETKREGSLEKEGASIDTSTDLLTESEVVKLRKDATRQFLKDSFGSATEVLTLVERQVSQALFEACFINRGNILTDRVGVVRDEIELNRNLRDYQDLLLTRITNFLNTIIDNAPELKASISKDKKLTEALANPRMYRDKEYTNILETLRPLINNYLRTGEVIKTDDLHQLYFDMNNQSASEATRTNARLKLEAYNANVILTHFDNILAIFTDAIKIDNFSDYTNEDKYHFASKTAKVYTTWRTHDPSVEEEADGITKLAITTTPLCNWQDNTPIKDRYLQFSDFEHCIAKIKDLSYRADVSNIRFGEAYRTARGTKSKVWNALTPKTQEFLRDKTLRQAINYIRENPREYISAIFELLTNKDFYTDNRNTFMNSFNSDELSRLWSLSKYIFHPNSEESIYKLMDGKQIIDFYANITETVDSIFSVNYIQYYRDEDGVLQVRTLIDQSLNNIKRNIEQTINTANSIKKIRNYEDYAKNVLKLEGSKTRVTFTIPGTSVQVTYSPISNNIIFKDSNNITDAEYLAQDKNVIKFIDDILRLNIDSNIDLVNALRNEYGQKPMYNDLLGFAASIVANQYLSYTYLKNLNPEESTKQAKTIWGRSNVEYNYKLGEISLIIGGNAISTLRNITKAKASVLGVTNSSQVKDSEGNGQSLSTLSRLLGSFRSQWDILNNVTNSATKDCLLFTPGLLEGVFTVKEYYDGEETKQVTDMNPAEMAYQSIINDYLDGLEDTPINEVRKGIVGDGKVLFLPSVNSDKSTISRLLVNLNIKVQLPSGELKSLRDCNTEELDYVITSQFGTIYTRVYEKIVSDWAKLDALIKQHIPNAPSLSSDYLYGFTKFNTWWYTEGSREEVVNGKTVRIGTSFREKSPADFIEKVIFEYNQSNRLHPLELIDQIHYKQGEGGKLTINNAFIDQIARYNPDFLKAKGYNPELTHYTKEQYWDIKKREVIKSLLRNKFEVNTKGKQKSLATFRKNYKSWYNKSGNMVIAKVWIDGKDYDITSEKDLYLLTDYNGDITRAIDDLAKQYKLELNPILEKYNQLNYLFSELFKITTVGTFCAHPEKSKNRTKKQKDVYGEESIKDRTLRSEDAHINAQDKRNVSFTAAMHAFQLNLLEGIPDTYNMAVIRDIKDFQGTILGSINEIKPFDGATFVNPFIVILENIALGGARAGVSKKQFVHFYNAATASGGIIKTAGFGLTNDWIRNSPFLQRMMRKMTNHIWLDENGQPVVVDITRNYRTGENIDYGKQYFKKGNRIFEITNIKSIGNNQYVRTIVELGIDKKGRCDGGTYISEPSDEIFTINNNYDLWWMFGGDHSMEMKGKFLEYSNSSVEQVVIAMNSVAQMDVESKPVLRKKSDGTFYTLEEVTTQKQIWQPLKHSDIHYIPTEGAVKQGAANINSADKYWTKSNDLNTQRVRMLQAGIQLDKEHHADDSELSLMTQVISACAAKGYTFEAAARVYDALRIATNKATNEFLTALKQYITTDSTEELQEVVIKTIVKALSQPSTNTSNFAEIIAKDLISQAKSGIRIKYNEVSLPLSDNTIYAKILSTLSSYLTKSGIKQKIAGILSVLTPSYNIFKLYGDRKYESFNNPEGELQQLQDQQVPIFDDTLENPGNISDIKLGREYFITYNVLTNDIDGNPVIIPSEPISVPINTPVQYKKLKQDIKDGKVSRVVENIVEGRDLASYNVRGVTSDGISFNLWDLDTVTALFEVDAIDKDENLKPEDKIEQKRKIAEQLFPDYPDAVVNLKKLLYRQLQRDLANISSSQPGSLEQFNKLLESRETYTNWYERFARIVNLILGESNGNKVLINGKLVEITEQNFEQYYNDILSRISTRTQVRINGQLKTVDKTKTKSEAYECILPKIFATNFGLKEFDDLSAISNNKFFFLQRYIDNMTTILGDPRQYSVELKRVDGKHIYLLNKKDAINAGLTKVPEGNVYKSTIDDKRYRTDQDGNIIYGITDDFELYKSGDVEVIVTDDLDFYIDNLSYDSIRLSRSLELRPSIVNHLCEHFKKSKNRQLKFFGEYITNKGTTEFVSSIIGNSEDYNTVEVTRDEKGDIIDAPLDNPIVTNNLRRHTSFLKSLEVVAARIPAQSMQSFMPMKVVAFDNPDINTAHVSTLQILLQGSDY